MFKIEVQNNSYLMIFLVGLLILTYLILRYYVHNTYIVCYRKNMLYGTRRVI